MSTPTRTPSATVHDVVVSLPFSVTKMTDHGPAIYGKSVHIWSAVVRWEDLTLTVEMTVFAGVEPKPEDFALRVFQRGLHSLAMGQKVSAETPTAA